ncbi:dihydrofolate reductase [Paraburkholderia sp. GAS41]|jgi:dihydrofolate reductase|uniref:dihydrofolate reductase n=1 Tax=Paraburkholderia sp. GAS41 TaxID=3035134 RepID=UPI003D23398F
MLNGKTISMIAAMAKNRVIGAANGIPWKVPGEQQRFRQLTEGNLVMMGRRTYESIGRPLPNRDILVIGRRPIVAERVSTCATMQTALEIIANDSREEVFIAGGEQIYRLFLPYADMVYLTELDLEPAGDTTFPDLTADFNCIERVEVSGPINYTLSTYRRATDHSDKLA